MRIIIFVRCKCILALEVYIVGFVKIFITVFKCAVHLGGQNGEKM